MTLAVTPLGDRVLAAVRGGCVLASLSLFDVFQEERSFQVGKGRVPPVNPFYQMCISPVYWLFELSTKSELEAFYLENFAAKIEVKESCPYSPNYGRRFLEDVSSEEEEEEREVKEEEEKAGEKEEEKGGEKGKRENKHVDEERAGNEQAEGQEKVDKDTASSDQPEAEDQTRQELPRNGTAEEAKSPHASPPPSTSDKVPSTNTSSSIPSSTEAGVGQRRTIVTEGHNLTLEDTIPLASGDKGQLEESVAEGHAVEKSSRTGQTTESSDNTDRDRQEPGPPDTAVASTPSDPTGLNRPQTDQGQVGRGARTSAKPRQRRSAGSEAAGVGETDREERAGRRTERRRNSRICFLF